MTISGPTPHRPSPPPPIVPLGWYVTVAAACVLGATNSPLVAQRVIEERSSCLSCITINEVTTLGALDDSVSLGGIPSLIRTAGGFAALSRALHPSTVLLYSADGRLEGRLGRRGNGPGEFSNVWYFGSARGDSVMIGELGRRVHIFSGDGGGGRTIAVRSSGDQGLQLASGDLAFAGPVATRSEFGAPFRTADPQGGHLGSFGGEGGVVPTRPAALYRIVTPATDTTFWALKRDEYDISEWSVRGQRIRHFIRPADWFSPPASDATGADPAIVDAILHDAEAPIQLLVLLWVPDPDRSGDPPIGQPVTGELLDGQYDTRIEVIDLRTGEVVASTTDDRAYLGFGAADILYRMVDTEAGLRQIIVSQLNLRSGTNHH